MGLRSKDFEFGFAMFVDLEIESFASNISLYFAFATATTAAAEAVVSLFQVRAPFFGFGFFFALRCSSSAMWGLVVGFLCILLDFFVWLLVVLMVVESGFVVDGGDETRFGCGFHVLHVESRR